jgi:hypothetical protein
MNMTPAEPKDLTATQAGSVDDREHDKRLLDPRSFPFNIVGDELVEAGYTVCSPARRSGRP